MRSLKANLIVSTANASDSLSKPTDSGRMTTVNGRAEMTSGMRRREPRLSAPRLILGVTFVAILIGIIYATEESAHLVASLAGFATAIALMAVAGIGWERIVVTAESAGLVERPH